jgi:hypothetical protein
MYSTSCYEGRPNFENTLYNVKTDMTDNKCQQSLI